MVVLVRDGNTGGGYTDIVISGRDLFVDVVNSGGSTYTANLGTVVGNDGD